jgi:uncharacterized integral membrane protein
VNSAQSSKTPVWLFIKYTGVQSTIGRQDIYEISRLGKIFNIILVGSLTLILISTYLMMNFSILYLAHIGLSDSFAHICIYLVCVLCILVAVVGILGNALNFGHTVRSELLLADPKFQEHTKENRQQEDGSRQ